MNLKDQLQNLAQKFSVGGTTESGPGFGKKIVRKYQDDADKEIVEFEDGTRMYTDSNEYKKLYSEGLLYGESPEKITYPQETGANSEMDRFKRIELENPYSDFVKPYFDGTSGVLARGFGQSEQNLANTPDDLKQKYDQDINKKWAQEIFKENPRNENEERGAYLNRVGSGLKPDILKNLYDYMPEREMETYWQLGEKGVAALTDLKGFPGLENFSNLEDYIQGSNHMSDYEKSKYFSDLKENPNSTRLSASEFLRSFQVGGEIENMLSKLNPKNWGVEDYTNKGNFQKAYTSARQKGLKEFMFEGKRFSTDYKGTPDEQLRQTGIIDNVNKNKPSELQKRITGNVYNGGFYHDYKLSDVEKLLQPVVKKERSIGLEEEMLNLYLKIPTQGRSLGISKYKPTKAKDKGVQYYKVNDFTSGLDEDVENIEEYASKLNANKKGNAGMGDYTVDSGKDARGKYISYYDIWDINPFGQGKDAPDLSMGYGKPFEIYDRIYYNDYGNKGKYKKMYFSDDELRNLHPDEKNFDTLAVQKELTNRGYKLPNSIKKKGLFDDNSEFDGIYGDETKKALQDWQSKNTKKFQSGGMIRSELQKLSEKFSQRLSTT